jgi:PAS domain S-box-containing protein
LPLSTSKRFLAKNVPRLRIPLAIWLGASLIVVLILTQTYWVAAQPRGLPSGLMILLVLASGGWLVAFVRRQGRMAATLTATLDAMDQGLVMVDRQGIVQVHNRRVAELLDLPENLLRSRPSMDQIRAYQIEQGDFTKTSDVERRWAPNALRSGPHSYERERSSGTVLEIRTMPLPDGGVVRTYTDVTSRRKTEAAIADSEQRYRLLADSSSDVIVVRRLSGEWSYVSPACRAVLGYEPEELQERATEDLVHPDDRADVSAFYGGLGALDIPAIHLHRLRHKGGHFVWIELVVSLIRGADGRSIFLGSMRDVSERHRQAEELRVAKELAEQASRAKSDFLASMSHEIRTPLNSIIGFTGVLLDRPNVPPDERRYVQLIQGSGSALLTLVNDILDFSKIEAGRVELDPQPFSLPGLLEDTVAIIGGMAAEKEIEISISAAPEVPRLVVGDSDRLRQILLNFLNNAVKFTRKGYVGLRVEPCGTTGSGDCFRFSVTDTGIGIPKDKQGRLFEHFSQVDGSIRREFGGTGLGLAISKRLVELMGGTVGVQSEPGVGSTFWFEVSLPLGESLQFLQAGAPVLTGPCGMPARVLLAEDLDLNQELAQLILSQAGHRVDIAGNGAEALQAVQRGHYDMVLMDVQMPVMDGVTATEMIRALPGLVRHIPIIALTANVLPDQIARFKAAGMNDHVGKPFRPHELLAAVRRWMPEIVLERPAPPQQDAG